MFAIVFARFENFKEVHLDFNGIEEIGQAFADEIFRVYALQHPDIVIVSENVSPSVARMIRRAEIAKAESGGKAGSG